MDPLDFIYPKGRLKVAWFPDEDLIDSLREWIALAEAETRDVKAQEAYVYWRAYQSKCEGVAETGEVASESIDRQGSITYRKATESAINWCLLAQEFLNEFNKAVGVGAYAVIRTLR